jgi:hypothetical protein
MPLTAARGPQNQCLGNSLAARSLRNDRQARKSNIHKINQIEPQIEEFQYDDAMAR